MGGGGGGGGWVVGLLASEESQLSLPIRRIWVSFEQEKGHLRRDKLGRFYSSREEGNQHLDGEWFQEYDVKARVRIADCC